MTVEVVAALPLSERARKFLGGVLGDDHHLVDIRESGSDADIVIAPPCGSTAIAALQRSFPSARVVVVELEDPLFDVHLKGPVRRSLDAGAAAYYVARSTEELGTFVRALPVERTAALETSTSALTVDDLVIQHAAEAAVRRRRSR